MIRVSVNTRGANIKLKRVQEQIKKGSENTVRDLAYMGRNYARDVAPHYTGKTASLIKVFRGKTNNGDTAEIRALNPTANDGHIRKIKNFNLVRWMHTSPKATGHIRSGKPKFMFSTADWLRGRVGSVVNSHFKLK